MSMAGLVARKGAPIVWTHDTPGVQDETTGNFSAAVTTTVAGNAMEIDGDPDLYKALSLIETDNPTLLFIPQTVGQYPPLGSNTVWGGNSYALKNRKMLAMNGTVKAVRCVVGK